MGTVYVIRNKHNGFVYVGITTVGLKTRMISHFSEARRSKVNTIFYKEIRRIGLKNFYIESLESCENDILFERETYWIEKLNSVFPNGYNLSFGGGGGKPQSDKTKKKKSKSQIKRFSKKREKKLHSIRMKKMFAKQEHKESHRVGLISSWTDERREHARELAKNNKNLIAAKGYLLSKEVCSKSVELFDSETKKILEFPSAKDACRHLGVSLTCVSQSMYRRNLILDRYIAKHKSDTKSFSEIIVEIEEKKAISYMNVSVKRQGRVPPNIKGLCLRNAKTNQVLTFKTVKEAAQFIGRQTTNVSHACKKSGRLVNGFYAEYIDKG